MLIKLEKLSSSTKPVTQECKGRNHPDGKDFPRIASGVEEEGVGTRCLFSGREQCGVILSILTLCVALEID